MSDIAINEQTFASGRYSKRKRTQVTYHMDELDVSDSESDFESVQTKKRKAVTPKRLPQSKVFPFMQLPAEIRNMIYTYALEDPSGINLVAIFKHKRRTVQRVSAYRMSEIGGAYHYPNDDLRDKHEEPVAFLPSLLAVSKQIYQEGRDILYNNEFVFADTATLYNFMLNLSPAGAKQLKHLRIMQWNYGRGMRAYNHACFAVLGQATNLRTLHLDKLSGYARKPQGAAAQLYRDSFPWLEAIGAAKGKFDAGVDVLQIDPEVFDYVYWHQGSQRIVSGEEKREEFLAALRKLLEVQQNRVMTTPVGKSKKARAAVKVG